MGIPVILGMPITGIPRGRTLSICLVIGFRVTAIRPIPVNRLFFGGETVRVTTVRLTVRGVALAVFCVARLAFGLTVFVVRRALLVVVFDALRPDELERDDFALDFRPLELDLLDERPRELLDERPPLDLPLLERPRRAIIFLTPLSK
jgi:hypothetical protein